MSHEAINSSSFRLPVDLNQSKIPTSKDQPVTGSSILHDLESMSGAEKTVLTFSSFQKKMDNQDEQDFGSFLSKPESSSQIDFSLVLDFEDEEGVLDEEFLSAGENEVSEGSTIEQEASEEQQEVLNEKNEVLEQDVKVTQKEVEKKSEIESLTAELMNACIDIFMKDGRTSLFEHIDNTLSIGLQLHGRDNASAMGKVKGHVFKEVDRLFAEGKLQKLGEDGILHPMTEEDVAQLKENLEKSLHPYISLQVDLHQIKQESQNGVAQETKLNNQPAKLEENTIRGGRIADITPQKVGDAMVFIATFPSFKKLVSLEQHMIIHMKLAKAKEEVDNARNVQKLKRIEQAELEKEIVKDEIKKDEIKKILIKSDTLKHEMESKKETYGEEYAQVFFNVCGLVKQMVSEGLVKRVV